MSCWTYKGKCMEEQPEGFFGFIYCISVKYDASIPKELQGKIYVGKKQFTHSVKKKLSKKARKTTRKRVAKVTKDSGWLNYWGSNRELIADVKTYGEDKFIRRVLRLCSNKAELTYYEMFHQVDQDVMFTNSYNGWISCKVFKKNLHV